MQKCKGFFGLSFPQGVEKWVWKCAKVGVIIEMATTGGINNLISNNGLKVRQIRP